jgi:hypothetical protein
MMAVTTMRTAAMATAKVTVMATAATSLPLLKFVRVGRWHEDGDEWQF